MNLWIMYGANKVYLFYYYFWDFGDDEPPRAQAATQGRTSVPGNHASADPAKS
jgi:hypothetical protein